MVAVVGIVMPTGPISHMRGSMDMDECQKSPVTDNNVSNARMMADVKEGGLRPEQIFGNPHTWDATGMDRAHIVWCCEHIHKPQCDKQRTAVCAAAAQAGARLLCLKKAAQFSTWASGGCRSPFVLLTNWREAKPCIAAAQQYPWSRPVYTVVICEQPVQYMRARAWLESDPLLGQHVQVVDESSCPQQLVLEMLSRLSRHILPQLQLSTGQSGNPAWGAAPLIPRLMPTDLGLHKPPPTLGSNDVLHFNRETLATEPSSVVCPLVTSPADLLRYMFASASAAEVERMLRETMLDTYRE